MELRGLVMGTPHRRNPLQGHRYAGGRLWGSGQQTHVANSEHVPDTVAGTHGR